MLARPTHLNYQAPKKAEMKLDTPKTKAFITSDLFHELRCLLGAATIWQAFKNSRRGFDVAVAMDSSFVHARSLFQFFNSSRGGDDVSIADLGLQPYESATYDTWREPLNRHLFHISKGRLSPSNVQGRAHLKDQVLHFANEILDLWKRLEIDPLASVYATELKESRIRAIREAGDDAEGRISPLFSV